LENKKGGNNFIFPPKQVFLQQKIKEGGNPRNYYNYLEHLEKNKHVLERKY
jgi:hypothetical protein